ncbi:MAG: NUDIX domain-containing protein [Janthinobacterium lividum]
MANNEENKNEEIVTSSKRLYDGRILKLRLDTVMLPNGKTSQREIVEHRGAVAMVPMLDKDTVILVRQYRRAAETSLLEIPAGTRDPDEDVEACARRELAEEINYAPGRMIKLFQSFMAPGYSTEVIHTFLALDLTPVEGHTDEDEFLEIIPTPFAEALHMIETGEIVDAKSISGLLYAERILKEM